MPVELVTSGACAYDDCEQPIRASGICKRHYDEEWFLGIVSPARSLRVVGFDGETARALAESGYGVVGYHAIRFPNYAVGVNTDLSTVKRAHDGLTLGLGMAAPAATTGGAR